MYVIYVPTYIYIYIEINPRKSESISSPPLCPQHHLAPFNFPKKNTLQILGKQWFKKRIPQRIRRKDQEPWIHINLDLTILNPKLRGCILAKNASFFGGKTHREVSVVFFRLRAEAWTSVMLDSRAATRRKTWSDCAWRLMGKCIYSREQTWNPKLAVWKMTFPFQVGDVWFHAIFFRDFYQRGSRRKVYRFDFESPLLRPKNLKSIAGLTTEKPMVCLYWGWFRSWCPKKCQFLKESCRKELTNGLSIRAWLRR